MKPRLLDLFCGAGGAAMGYHRAGFEVVGVDIKPQPNYPFEFVRADALAVLRVLIDGQNMDGRWDDPSYPRLCDFDAIHASPPCQGYHSMGKGYKPLLINQSRDLLRETGLPYVIENIPMAEWSMDGPIMICGTMFDPPLDGLKRHRLFEANWPLEPPQWPCRHKLAAKRFRVYEHGRWYMSEYVKVYGSGGGKARQHWGNAMEIDWMTDKEMVEAIPPAYTEFIGQQLMSHLEQKVAA